MQFLPMSSCSRVDSSCLITFIPICRKFLVFADVLATCTFKYWLTMTPLHTWAILRYTSQTHHKHRSLTQDSFPPDPFVVPQACSAIPELRVLVYQSSGFCLSFSTTGSWTWGRFRGLGGKKMES